MSKQREAALVILVICLALLCWRVSHHRLPSSSSGKDKTSGAPDTTELQGRSAAVNPPVPLNFAEEALTSEATTPQAPVKPPTPVPAPTVPETLESTSLPAATVLENMRTTIRQYASAFGENPVGTNPEITTALDGENSKHINFLKQDGNRVNARGELVDIWGTPYFFHQISGHEMEIRSAGPDRVMYTPDDLITR
jgi:hypothetical protein